MRLIVMGISSSGKTRIGMALADRLNLDFFDADDFHSEEARARMARGEALGEAERGPWLARLVEELSGRDGFVLACSALRASHRDVLREGLAGARFLFLHGDPDIIRERFAARSDHFFREPDLLEDQLATLEPPAPDEAIHLPIDRTPDEIVALAVERLGLAD